MDQPRLRTSQFGHDLRGANVCTGPDERDTFLALGGRLDGLPDGGRSAVHFNDLMLNPMSLNATASIDVLPGGPGAHQEVARDIGLQCRDVGNLGDGETVGCRAPGFNRGTDGHLGCSTGQRRQDNSP